MRLLFIYLTVLLAIDIQAQTGYNIHGNITDQEGRPISGATVYSLNHDQGVISDSMGYFNLNLNKKGLVVVTTSHVSYQPKTDTLFVEDEATYNNKLTPVMRELPVIEIRSIDKIQPNREVLSFRVFENRQITQNNAGNLVKTLEMIPGINSMNIGSGFSKPVIRGMAFNRVATIDRNIKQEGQQWGADHGLEIDQYSVDQVMIYKGPMSLMYGSDAIGGVIALKPARIPHNNTTLSEVITFAASNNDLIGISAMGGIKRNNWFFKARFTGQSFGDYRIPVDTITYLTRKLPVTNNRLKNTAGNELSVSTEVAYSKDRFKTRLLFSEVYQKTGFYPGAHGIPDLRRVIDDGDSRNVEFPYSNVSHTKIISNSEIMLDGFLVKSDIAYQKNHRQEWSKFHTHYGNQAPPVNDPDLELDFNLNTISANVTVESTNSSPIKSTIGINTGYQANRINGYSFLLPEFNRLTMGLFVVEVFKLSERMKMIGGLRVDLGRIDIKKYRDEVLGNYLLGKNEYSPSEVIFYSNRSFDVDKWLTDYSGSLGIAYNPNKSNTLKVNIGRSFRMPAVNELASNGVHHGTFRHELGDSLLKSEVGYQFDAGYTYEANDFQFALSPFISWFQNYIFLEPTGQWSILPHAGQIYKYNQARTLVGGGELTVSKRFKDHTEIESGLEYVYMQNLTDGYPLPFSPPASIFNSLNLSLPIRKQKESYSLKVEHRYTFAQNRVARNEEKTPDYNLFNLSFSVSKQLNSSKFEIIMQLRNLLNQKYFNHLSYYRKLHIPEAGRNVQISLKYSFN